MMNRTKIAAVIVSVAMAGLPTLGTAQTHRGHDQEDKKAQQQGHRQPAAQAQKRPVQQQAKPAQQQARRGNAHRQPERQPEHHARGAGPQRDLHRGSRLPRDFHRPNYVVNDWRRHQLPAPGRGQQWVQVGADYVLIAIATGIIASVVLSAN